MSTSSVIALPRRRWLLVLLAALTVVLGVLTPAGAAAATPPSVAESRVRVFLPAAPALVGVHESITAGGRWVRGPSQPQLVSGCCVATEDAGRAVEKCGLLFSPDTGVVMADRTRKPISQVHVGGHRGLDGQAVHFVSEELAQLTHQHVGAAEVPGRPSFGEIHRTLLDGSASRLTGQNAMQFEHQGVRVIVNEDIPTKSTAYYLSR